MKKLVTLIALASLGTVSQAAEVSVKVTNLTQGIHFTPLLVAAHPDANSLFEVGEKASAGLQAMAEGGSLDGLVKTLESIQANVSTNPAKGLLAPTTSAMTTLKTTSKNDALSIVAMLLPTNDGFVGLDNWKIPSKKGTYTLYLNGYDAGTEANNELVLTGSGAPGKLGIPADPSGKAGTGGTGVTTTETTQVVHIHSGNLGDDNATGGKSDLDNTVHRWLNPVAKVTVTVK